MTETTERSTPLSVWVLADPRPGTAAQARAVAIAMAANYQVNIDVKALSYGLCARLPNWLIGVRTTGLSAVSRAALEPPWPDVIIAAGRRSAPVSRWVKRKSGGACFAVQVMYPGSAGIIDFDLVVVPHHDEIVETSNVMRITGAPHGMTDRRLDAARAKWSGRLEGIARPRIAVLVGGSTQRKEFSPEMARALGKVCANRVKTVGGSLLVSTSRRTPSRSADALFDELKGQGIDPALCHRWDGVEAGENPYDGLIALADLIVVTGDSISMCCEASTGPGALEIFAPPGFVSARHQRFIDEMFERGFANDVGAVTKEKPAESLNSARDIAVEVARRLGLD